MKRLEDNSKANFTVSILRQTTFDGSYYTAARRDATIGGGPIRQVAPPFSCPPQRDRELHLDWEGEVQVNVGIQFGGFSVSNVTVKVCPLTHKFLVCV